MFFTLKALSNSYCQNNTEGQEFKNNSGVDISRGNLIEKNNKLTLKEDTLLKVTLPKNKKALNSQVKYHARDSMRIELIAEKVYLFGAAQVEYETFKMSSDYIEIDFKQNTIFAAGRADSSGVLNGSPVFEEAGTSFTSKTMTYNFETKKGLIKDVITKQNDGYIHGEQVKKMENEVMYIKTGKYTTCDQLDPHFHLQVSKLKIIPNDKIVTGPAYLKIGGLPTPLALPFGFFPNKKGRSSGIIPPAPGQNQSLGFFLNNGGFYFGLSDNMDLQFNTDIYSKGSYAIRSSSNYIKKYRHRGNFRMSYSYFQTGFKELNIKPREDFSVQWNHSQDAKARPNTSFTASVNLSSNSFNRLNSSASNNYINNTMQSNIAYGKSMNFLGLPSNFSLNASHSQNTISRAVSITLPQAVFNVNRFYPFKKKVQVGAERAWEKIGVSYIGNARNQLNTVDTMLFNGGYKQLNNGVQHGFFISTSLKTNNIKWFKFLNYFTLTPSANYTDRWYFQTINKRDNLEKDSVITDTILGFKRIGEYSYNAALTTKIYGMLQFRNTFIKAVRHVITPSIGFSYKPEFNTDKLLIRNSDTLSKYSPFDIGAFGKPNSIAQGNINYSLINNIEMKVRSKKDTINGFQKIKIFENLSLNGSYNMLASDYNWSFVKLNARTNLLSNIDLVYYANFDPYSVDNDSVRVNKLEWDVNKKLMRMTDASLALNFRFNSKVKNNSTSNKANVSSSSFSNNNRGIYNDYVDFDIPWTINIYFNVNYLKPYKTFSSQVIGMPEYTPSLTFNGDFSLTPNWKIGVNSGYDFKLKDLSYTTLNFYRDLHCWEFRVNMTPIGLNKSYMITIGVKPGSLQDLKINKQLLPDYTNF